MEEKERKRDAIVALASSQTVEFASWRDDEEEEEILGIEEWAQMAHPGARLPAIDHSKSRNSGGFAANGYGEHSPGGYGMNAALITEIVMTFMFLFIINSFFWIIICFWYIFHIF